MKHLDKMGVQGSRNIWLAGLAAAGLCLAGHPALAAQDANSQAPAVLPWVSDVVKMNDAGVPPDLLANYIKNSPARSSLNADDIIYLRNHNISSGIITAMIEHGASAPATSAPQTAPAPAPVYAQAPPPQTYQQPPVTYADQQPADVYYNYNYSYPDYGYSYPYWNWYYPSYPVFFFPGRVGFNHRFGFDHRPVFAGGVRGFGGSSFHGFASSHSFGSAGGHMRR